MLNRLRDVEIRYKEIEKQLENPEVISDMAQYSALMREYKQLTPVIEKYREYLSAEQAVKEALEILETESDEEMRGLADEELRSGRERIEKLEGEIKLLLLPRDENDDKNVIVEIRGGAGGEEAALFAGVLYRMYTMYADKMRWKHEIVNANETELGGFKEVSFMIEGEGAYSKLKFESGVHRVQRVPETESSGRIHTSTVTVAVLPEVEDVEVEISPGDLKIETIKSSGAGGQHVNKTESAIRLLHIPTGIVIECQDERSQFKNRDKAMKLLRTKLFDLKQSEQNEKIASERKSQVGSGNRCERIRTYNYPQSRVTDHRIGLTLHSLESFLNGDIEEMIDSLATADASEKLKSRRWNCKNKYRYKYKFKDKHKTKSRAKYD